MLSSKIGKAALEVAVALIGRGEACDHKNEQGQSLRHNNCGPWIRDLRRDDKREAWCAAAVSYEYELGWAKLCGFPNWSAMPKAMQRQCPLKRSANAKALCTTRNPHLLLVWSPDTGLIAMPEPGDLALWHRGARNATTGHVGLLSRYVPSTGDFDCIEGNKGIYPSKVKQYPHELEEPGLLGIYRVPDAK